MRGWTEGLTNINRKTETTDSPGSIVFQGPTNSMSRCISSPAWFHTSYTHILLSALSRVTSFYHLPPKDRSLLPKGPLIFRRPGRNQSPASHPHLDPNPEFLCAAASRLRSWFFHCGYQALSQCLVCNSLNPHRLLITFYRGRIWHLERLINLPKVTQLVRGTAGV